MAGYTLSGMSSSLRTRHVRQVPVPLAEIEAVADHEAVRDLEAHVAHGHVDLAPLRLRQKRAHLEARRLARLEIAHQIGERQARVDDVLDDEDVPALDVDVEVLENPHNSRGVGRRAVARDGHEVDLARHRQMAHEVGQEEDGALEDADEEQVAACVVGGDLRAELGDPPLERRLLDQDLRDRLLELSRGQLSDLPLGMLDDARHGDDLVSAHDERPRLALRARAPSRRRTRPGSSAPTRQAVPGPPASHSKSWQLGADPPLPPAHLAVELDRPVLEPEPLVLAHRLDAAAEVDALRAGRRGEQLGERRRQRLARVERAEDVLVGGRVEAAEAAAGSRRGSGRASCRRFDESVRNGKPSARQ